MVIGQGQRSVSSALAGPMNMITQKASNAVGLTSILDQRQFS